MDRDDTEVLMYIKYAVSHTLDRSALICPPVVEGWHQLCMYLGHPDLEDNERDFVYGGTQEGLDDMERSVDAYFARLRETGVVESFQRDVRWNQPTCTGT